MSTWGAGSDENSLVMLRENSQNKSDTAELRKLDQVIRRKWPTENTHEGACPFPLGEAHASMQEPGPKQRNQVRRIGTCLTDSLRAGRDRS